MPRIPSVHKLQPPGRPDFYQLELDGKRYYLGTHRIRAEAKAAELKRRHYGVMPTDAPQSVAELVALWNHQRPGREYAVARWTKFRGPVSLDEIKADHFDGYMRALIKHGYSDWVIRESITYAHAVCRWAYDREWLDRVPRKPKTPTPIRRPRDVAPELVAKLLGLVHERPRRLLTFIAVTGCRPGEACKLYLGKLWISTEPWRSSRGTRPPARPAWSARCTFRRGSSTSCGAGSSPKGPCSPTATASRTPPGAFVRSCTASQRSSASSSPPTSFDIRSPRTPRTRAWALMTSPAFSDTLIQEPLERT